MEEEGMEGRVHMCACARVCVGQESHDSSSARSATCRQQINP